LKEFSIPDWENFKTKGSWVDKRKKIAYEISLA